MVTAIDSVLAELPLTGVVLCCTSLSQEVRNALAAVAEEMGAVHKLDLTSDVTHLVVGNTATAKYRYVARERPDIKVLHPAWVGAVREKWVDAMDVDVTALEEEHRLPTFQGLQICLTGFDDFDLRNAMITRVQQEGATHHGDLTKVITHLIAAGPSGKKYEAAKLWGVAVVSQKWYDDSLARGMALDESLYDPLLPVEEQGKGAVRLNARARTSLGKRGRDGEAEGTTEAARKRLRRSASTRLESQSQDMWQDISAQSVVADTSEMDQWTEREQNAAAAGPRETTVTRRTIPQPADGRSDQSPGLFSGIHVLLWGFDAQRQQRLEDFLEPNGATIVSKPTKLKAASSHPSFKQQCLLVPHDASPATILEPDVPVGTMRVTEWWVERCIHFKKLLNPEQDILSAPLVSFASSALQNMCISTTGLASLDLRQCSKAVEMMGAAYMQVVQPSSSVLVCGTKAVKEEKSFYAQKHGIPVVTAEWLWACLRSGKRVPFDEYLMPLLPFDASKFASNASSIPTAGVAQQRDATEPSIRKDEHVHQRLSNTKKKQATPSLPLQVARLSRSTITRKPEPFIYEDDDDDPSLDGGISAQPPATNQETSQPLQELSPNCSPRKRNEMPRSAKDGPPSDSVNRLNLRPAPNIPPASPEPLPANAEVDEQAPARQRPGLDADISDLLNRNSSSRPASASDPQKRKNRPLGRAPSGISNRSFPASNHSGQPSPVPQSDEVPYLPEEVTVASREAPPPPSTQLGYETAEAEQHRLQMSKRMGAKVEDEGGLKRLASLGTVKDSVATAGVGNRVRGRHRAKCYVER